NGQSPFAADRGHLHHRLLNIGHSHSRSVLIMYFWSALIAFGAVGYSVHSTSLWIVIVIVGLSALGLILLLLPAFTPRAPRWAERFVPPRYRRRRRRAEGPGAASEEAAAGQQGPVDGQMETGVAAAVPGVNGATAIGHRSRTADRRAAGSTRR
ncbi:undecaprenyl/decaprenyl-phosphate alpha-N-acetylglucosaminyl 1-phosphate transferase, partial [Streptomyces rubiginosohelvolus]